MLVCRNMWVKIVFIGFCIINLAGNSNGATFTYKYNSDIYDRKNWENDGPQKDCDGLIMPKSGLGVIKAKHLEIKQFVFGDHFTFFFNDDTDIVFNENSKSDMNCAKLNYVQGFWVDINKWTVVGKEINEAVPDIERLPGKYDDVILPNGVMTEQILIPGDLTIRSFKFGNEQWTNQDYFDHTQDPILSEVLLDIDGGLHIRNATCTDETGCTNGNELQNIKYCWLPHIKRELDCVDPIEAIGFCTKICGASIVFVPGFNFKIKYIEEKLKQYYSETYVSKVKTMVDEYVIQIIFTEKQFTGSSLEEAKDLRKKLIDEKIIGSNADFLVSGNYYKEGEGTKTTLSLVFGSLVTVCLIFGLIYLIFEKKGRFANVRERLGLGQGPLTYRSILFSRNLSLSEGTGLIMEGQSTTGSVQNILKAFQNPSFSEFKKKSPSTSEASDSSDEGEAEASRSEVEEKTETDLFEEKDRRDLIESVAEDGELVDLSEMK